MDVNPTVKDVDKVMRASIATVWQVINNRRRILVLNLKRLMIISMLILFPNFALGSR